MTTTHVIIAATAFAFLVVIVLYNGLVRRRNRIDNAWSSIGVELRRRYDLIPNLVDTVKGYVAHEASVLEAVVRARNAAISAQGVTEQAQAENVITGALRQLFALSEAYPALQANQNFLALQEELTTTESRIAFSRQYYNDAVLTYDNHRGVFPMNLVARLGGFTARPYFQVGDDAAAPVRVGF